MFEMSLKEFEFGVHSVHIGGARDMSVQPLVPDHFREVKMGEPKFFKSKGLSLG